MARIVKIDLFVDVELEDSSRIGRSTTIYSAEDATQEQVLDNINYAISFWMQRAEAIDHSTKKNKPRTLKLPRKQ